MKYVIKVITHQTILKRVLESLYSPRDFLGLFTKNVLILT